MTMLTYVDSQWEELSPIYVEELEEESSPNSQAIESPRAYLKPVPEVISQKTFDRRHLTQDFSQVHQETSSYPFFL